MTPSEFIREKLFHEFGFGVSHNIFEQLKVIEKEIIVNAYNQGYRDGEELGGIKIDQDIAEFNNAADYYEEHFLNNNK